MKQFEKDKEALREFMTNYTQTYGKACRHSQEPGFELYLAEFDKLGNEYHAKWESLKPKVKQLEWKKSDFFKNEYYAEQTIRYEIYEEDGEYILAHLGANCPNTIFSTLEEAKAVCQKHFEEFILGQIE